jgi:hypothetical protein
MWLGGFKNWFVKKLVARNNPEAAGRGVRRVYHNSSVCNLLLEQGSGVRDNAAGGRWRGGFEA